MGATPPPLPAHQTALLALYPVYLIPLAFYRTHGAFRSQRVMFLHSVIIGLKCLNVANLLLFVVLSKLGTVTEPQVKY